jgi:hypothetical protein
VDHEPQASILVSLQLNEVIAASNGGELHCPDASPEALKPGVTQLWLRQAVGHTDRLSPISPARWYRLGKTGEDARSGSRVANLLGLRIERHGQHSAADVTAYGLWIHEAHGCHSKADTHILGQMNVRHHGNMLHIWRAT